MIHIDYAPIQKCKSFDTYGVICVKCNKCHRFNPDFVCINCKRITRAMKSYNTWELVELYDVLKAPVCPDCQRYFTDGEMGIGREWWNRDIISCRLKDFKRRYEELPR